MNDHQSQIGSIAATGWPFEFWDLDNVHNCYQDNEYRNLCWSSEDVSVVMVGFCHTNFCCRYLTLLQGIHSELYSAPNFNCTDNVPVEHRTAMSENIAQRHNERSVVLHGKQTAKEEVSTG